MWECDYEFAGASQRELVMSAELGCSYCVKLNVSWAVQGRRTLWIKDLIYESVDEIGTVAM